MHTFSDVGKHGYRYFPARHNIFSESSKPRPIRLYRAGSSSRDVSHSVLPSFWKLKPELQTSKVPTPIKPRNFGGGWTNCLKQTSSTPRQRPRSPRVFGEASLLQAADAPLWLVERKCRIKEPGQDPFHSCDVNRLRYAYRHVERQGFRNDQPLLPSSGRLQPFEWNVGGTPMRGG